MAIGDIDGDGRPEVVALGEDDGNIYAWHHDGTLVAGWPVATGLNLLLTGVTLGDMDGDGRPEVLVGGTTPGGPPSWHGEVWAFHGDGTPVAGWPQAMPDVLCPRDAPALGDIDGDGQPEVVVPGDEYYIYAWHHDGRPVEGWPVHDQSIVCNPGNQLVLGDIDGDGKLEVLLGTDFSGLFAWHGDGSVVAGWPLFFDMNVDHLGCSTPALGDVDGDGRVEVVVKVDDCRVYVLRGNGSVLAGWPQGPVNTSMNPTYHFLGGSPPTLGDLDGDGHLEVLAVCALYPPEYDYVANIYAWHGNGTLVAGWPQSTPTCSGWSTPPVLADLDGDGRPEVLVDTYAFHGNGTQLAGCPQPTSPGVLGDLDGDGDLEMAEAGSVGLYVYSFDMPTNDRLPWPMFQHDACHTGCYTGYPVLSSGSVTPQSGDAATRFTWRVKYWDTAGLAPTGVSLGIRSAGTQSTSWRQMWALDPADTNCRDGKWYTYTCYLPVGDYSYRFVTQAGAQSAYWPAAPDAYQPGPTVVQANPAALTGGYVTPEAGTSTTRFTWRIRYWNTENAMPEEVKVGIWSAALKTTDWRRMWAYDPSDTNCVDGKWYTYSSTLPAGTYAYCFAARTPAGAQAYWPSPEGTNAPGPAVTAASPDDAAVVSSAVPAAALRNAAQQVTVTMRNTGTATWTQAAGYALSAVNPDDNTTWGLSRVQLDPSDSIATGQTKTFTLNITAPNGATYLSGPIHCDWQMVHGSTRFGAVCANQVEVYSFVDVTPDLPYWKHVEAIYTAGLTGGCGSDGQGRALYCPLSNCTRAMMAVLLVRAKGMTPLMSPTPHFGDVGSGLSYYGHVERLADAGSWYDAGNACLTTPTAGCAPSPPRYCPDDNCTRATMAVFLCRAAGKCPYTVQERPTPTFADVGTGLSYYGFVERLADAASWNNDPPTTGCTPSPPRFCPDDIATRAQMAVFLARAFQLPYQ